MSRKMKGVVLLLAVILLVYFMGESVDLGWDQALLTAPVYVALGDSVAYGMSAGEGEGYNDRFRSYLQDTRYRRRARVDYRNLSRPGDTSEELYTLIRTETYAAALQEADIITINIGGNHLLQSLLYVVQSAYPEVSASSGGLRGAITRNPWPALRLVVGFQDPASRESDALNLSLGRAVSTFESYWPQILRELARLAPEAEIYVNTLYNPVTREEPLYDVIDPYIERINAAIRSHGNQYRYTVVDVHRAFDETGSGLVDFSLVRSPIRTDIHPNTEGHAVIFETLKVAMESRKPY